MHENYIESHTFPRGVVIDYYAEPGKEYAKELREVTDQAGLDVVLDKWRDLAPEIPPIKFEDLVAAFDLKAQEEMISKYKTDEGVRAIFNVLMPQTLMRYSMAAKHYEVSEGLVILQIYNGGGIEVKDGRWHLKEKGKE